MSRSFLMVVSSTMVRKSGKICWSDFFREGLSFGDVLLAMAFGAVAEDFVEEYGGGAAGEQRRSYAGSFSGAATRPSSSLRMVAARGVNGFDRRGRRRVDPVKIVIAVDVHAVRGFALNENSRR